MFSLWHYTCTRFTLSPLWPLEKERVCLTKLFTKTTKCRTDHIWPWGASRPSLLSLPSSTLSSATMNFLWFLVSCSSLPLNCAHSIPFLEHSLRFPQINSYTSFQFYTQIFLPLLSLSFPHQLCSEWGLEVGVGFSFLPSILNLIEAFAQCV